MNEDMARAITATIIYIDFIPFNSLATLSTLKVLNILTDLKALKEVFFPPDEDWLNTVSSSIDRTTTPASRKFILSLK